jgi:putative endopeptidase
MKTLIPAAVMAAILAAGAAPAADAPQSVTAPRLGSWGFDTGGRNLAVSPGDDFYAYANGTALKALAIPADRSRYGSFDKLGELSLARQKAVLTEAAANPAASGEEAQIGAYYRAYMDEARIEALDAKPLEPQLAAIRAAKDRRDIAALMGRENVDYYGGIFGFGIQADEKRPTRYAVYLGQSGLGLPDRDYYLQPAFAAKKEKYQAYVAQMLGAANWPNAEVQAKAIVDLETRIAEASWTKAERRDPVKTYNPMSRAELAALAPGFPWDVYLAAGDLGAVDQLIVEEKTALPKIAAIYAATPLETLKAWEAFKVIDSVAPYLSKRFADARFEFREKTLQGQPEQKPRWKRAAATLNSDIGEAVGKVYVERYFPPESKVKITALVSELRVALAARIQKLDWMSPETKTRALEKLSKLTVKVGYPDRWRDYRTLRLTDDDLYGDVRRSTAFEWNREVNRLDQPVDRTEWAMTPQTVNAYYNPVQNEIVFPAAILQPPFFDPQADMAVNYGAIGGVIGHEMTHGFDDQGRQFDGDGVLADWWAPGDAAKFTAQTKRLGEQYSAFEPLPGAHVKGDLTMGENIADLGGLLLGLDAYHLSLKGAPAPTIDGLTGDQRVFLGWAQVWRQAIRDDAQRQLVVTDPHSPAKYRVNGVVRNIDAWYPAFGVKPGEALYLAPEARVRIW